jgi:hypothetical protein
MNEGGEDDNFDVFLRDVLHRSPGAEPPPGFARATAERVADLPDTDVVEKYVTHVLLGLAVIAAGVCAFLCFDSVANQMREVLRGAPWPLLLTAGVAFGAVKLAEFAGLAGLDRAGR